jgi:hypothetical protein
MNLHDRVLAHLELTEGPTITEYLTVALPLDDAAMVRELAERLGLEAVEELLNEIGGVELLSSAPEPITAPVVEQERSGDAADLAQRVLQAAIVAAAESMRLDEATMRQLLIQWLVNGNL